MSPANLIFHLPRCVAIVLVAAILCPAIYAQEGGAVPSASRNAVLKRQEQLIRLQEREQQGDRMLADGDVQGAYETYRSVFREAPGWVGAEALRESSFQRYQTALRQHADDLAESGQVEQAERLVVQFFQDAQESQMPAELVERETRFLLEDLRDLETYEPGNSAEREARLAEVKRWFALADASVQLGKFDEATQYYAMILDADPTNRAARRGMEQVDQLVSAYYRVAADQTRATMLAQVTAAWENPVPRYSVDGSGPPVGGGSGIPTDEGSVRSKLNGIRVPSVEFVQTPLENVLAYLTNQSRMLDAAGQGVNIVLDAQGADRAVAPITLRLSNVSLGEVIDYASRIAGMKYRVDQYAVTVVPMSAPDSTALITKQYRVPPDFINSGSMGGGGADPFGSSDPFADLGGAGGAGESTLQKRLTAQEFLTQNGVLFPEGAMAQFIASTSMLLVRNTEDQLELVEAMVEGSYGSVAKLLKISVRILETTQNDLKEIGFDWLLDQFNVPGSNRVFGSGGTYGNTSQAPGVDLNRDYPFVEPGSSQPFGRFPVTSGNRTGGGGQFADSVDQALNRTVNVLGAVNSGNGLRSPGVFSVAGVFTDPQYQVVVRAIDQKKAADIGATTTVVTKAGQIASVRGVRELIYPSEYDPPEVSDVAGEIPLGNNTVAVFQPDSFAPVTPAHPAAFETRELGTILEVEGNIGPDGYTVDLTLTPEVVEFLGFINYGSPVRQIGQDATGNFFEKSRIDNPILQPVFRTLRNSTGVTIYDGETVVIGGLTQDASGMIEDKVPFLGDAPLIGRFFRSEIEQNDRQAIVFFVTVEIVDPSGASPRSRQNLSQVN